MDILEKCGLYICTVCTNKWLSMYIYLNWMKKGWRAISIPSFVHSFILPERNGGFGVYFHSNGRLGGVFYHFLVCGLSQGGEGIIPTEIPTRRRRLLSLFSIQSRCGKAISARNLVCLGKIFILTLRRWSLKVSQFYALSFAFFAFCIRDVGLSFAYMSYVGDILDWLCLCASSRVLILKAKLHPSFPRMSHFFTLLRSHRISCYVYQASIVNLSSSFFFAQCNVYDMFHKTFLHAHSRVHFCNVKQ